ncbi:MAG: double-stranded uracil-DNA glycosylase [Acidimicrobiaceae bacterium]
MDGRTRDIYEAEAAAWAAKRHPGHLEAARDFGRSASGPSVDLGCGPGWYAGELAPPVIALDGARSMLELSRVHAPAALRVQADLVALPFRRIALGAAWARNSYVHLPRGALPLALADLHRSTRVGGTAVLSFFGGQGEGRRLFEDDDFPGRFFSLWEPEEVDDLVTGAGFTIDDVVLRSNEKGHRSIEVHATRARTLPDYVAPDLALLLCGLNPSLRAADAGVGFVTGSNRFWPAALAAGIVSRDRDPWHAARHDGVGFTDLVKRASVGAAELRPDEYREGFARVERLAAWLAPAAVCFVGLSGWRAAVDAKATAGWQERTVGGRPAYVMPNPSGLNAHTTPADLERHLRAAALPAA